MKILFMGHGKWACITLSEVARKHDVVGVVCETDAFDEKEKEHYKRFSSKGYYASLKDAAKGLGLAILQPTDINNEDFVKSVDTLNPELIVMVSYHGIVKEPLISKYHNKIINVHGAPLPNYRGRSPINWAIINGEDHTGVTVHFVAKEIDKGDIIAQEIIPIGPNEKAIDVLAKTLDCYPRLTIKAIEAFETDTVQRAPQDIFSGSYFPKRTPEDGRINWDWSTRDIHNLVRALSFPYPGAFTFAGDKKILVWDAVKPENQSKIGPQGGMVFGKTQEGYLKVTTGNSFIFLKSIQLEGTEERLPSETIKEGTRLE